MANERFFKLPGFDRMYPGTVSRGVPILGDKVMVGSPREPDSWSRLSVSKMMVGRDFPVVSIAREDGGGLDFTKLMEDPRSRKWAWTPLLGRAVSVLLLYRSPEHGWRLEGPVAEPEKLQESLRYTAALTRSRQERDFMARADVHEGVVPSEPHKPSTSYGSDEVFAEWYKEMCVRRFFLGSPGDGSSDVIQSYEPPLARV